MPKQKKEMLSVPVEEVQKMTPVKLKLEEIYLDPNNPRLLSDRRVDDVHVAEEPVQENLRKKIEKVYQEVWFRSN